LDEPYLKIFRSRRVYARNLLRCLLLSEWKIAAIIIMITVRGLYIIYRKHVLQFVQQLERSKHFASVRIFGIYFNLYHSAERKIRHVRMQMIFDLHSSRSDIINVPAALYTSQCSLRSLPIQRNASSLLRGEWTSNGIRYSPSCPCSYRLSQKERSADYIAALTTALPCKPNRNRYLLLRLGE